MPLRPLLVTLVLIGCLTVIGGVSRRARMPEAVVSSDRHSYDVSRCAECHEEICQSFAAAPHLRTLQPIQAEGARERFAGRDASLLGDRFRFTTVGDALHFGSERFPSDCTVDWVFGSGHHAQTPVALRQGPRGETELVQLHVSWFADGELGITPGSEEHGDRLPSLGIHHTAAETRRCFGCHTSHLPEEAGRIQFSGIEAGINCTRCHMRNDQHLASDGKSPTGANWTTLSPLEAINRCGECHRRADEFTPDELVPTATHLARFAPVGLVLSACFQGTHGPGAARKTARGESLRLDCTTCHDPHRPAQTDPRLYVQACLKCHHSTPSSAPDCSAQRMDSQCLTCHMPKVAINEHLSFTDHWIRVR